MAEWLFEAGIGENRAALVEDGAIIEARIEPEGEGIRAGSVADARLFEITVPRRRGLARLTDGSEILLEPLPAEWCEGALVRIEIVREAIPERGVVKRAKARPAHECELHEGPGLLQRIEASGLPMRAVGPGAEDALEAAGWSEVLEAAEMGLWAFAGGQLRIEPTAAMTVIDVDGHLAPPSLAMAAAEAAARAIRCFDLAGSIVIDFPTLGSKDERQAVAATFDQHLPPPFERTAINGYGLMQVIRPRLRPSLLERLRQDVPGAAARALLRRAERSGLIGAIRLVAPPAVVSVLGDHPAWLDLLARQSGGMVTLRTDTALAMSASYVEQA